MKSTWSTAVLATVTEYPLVHRNKLGQSMWTLTVSFSGQDLEYYFSILNFFTTGAPPLQFRASTTTPWRGKKALEIHKFNSTVSIHVEVSLLLPCTATRDLFSRSQYTTIYYSRPTISILQTNDLSTVYTRSPVQPTVAVHLATCRARLSWAFTKDFQSLASLFTQH